MADAARVDSAGGGRVEIRCSGSGGQGILLAAAIIAEAAAALGKRVVQTQSYGPEARGGASKAEVIVSDEPIDYPEVRRPDVSLVLSQAAYEKYAVDTRPGGLLIYDSGLVEVDPDDLSLVRCGLPFTQVATDELGKTVVTNIIAVGALARISEVLPAVAVRNAVLNRVPAKFKELNGRAYDLGLRLGEGAVAMLADSSATGND
ncbi:MAG TPA: 2-oxoacid:acceptor oxidoreductase family protein [Thermoleophilia bacterium]|nr:2-oxoacid:acceptor oxidoreductase family protein [Thermoleophilia bacterium]